MSELKLKCCIGHFLCNKKNVHARNVTIQHNMFIVKFAVVVDSVRIEIKRSKIILNKWNLNLERGHRSTPISDLDIQLVIFSYHSYK